MRLKLPPQTPQHQRRGGRLPLRWEQESGWLEFRTLGVSTAGWWQLGARTVPCVPAGFWMGHLRGGPSQNSQPSSEIRARIFTLRLSQEEVGTHLPEDQVGLVPSRPTGPSFRFSGSSGLSSCRSLGEPGGKSPNHGWGRIFWQPELNQQGKQKQTQSRLTVWGGVGPGGVERLSKKRK